jgi:hypothetical protein
MELNESMQLSEVSEPHRRFVEAVIPDEATHEIVHEEVDNLTHRYSSWAVHDGWLRHALVEVTEPRFGQPERMRRATTEQAMTRLSAIQQVIGAADDTWTLRAPTAGEVEVPPSIATAVLAS